MTVLVEKFSLFCIFGSQSNQVNFKLSLLKDAKQKTLLYKTTATTTADVIYLSLQNK